MAFTSGQFPKVAGSKGISSFERDNRRFGTTGDSVF
jgi:hypothetical protein